MAIAQFPEDEMNNSKFKPTDISFTHVAEMFLAELRNGNTLSEKLLIETFPHLESEIKTLIPALAAAESVPQYASTPKSPAARPRPQLEELGGCKIVREVGRGAMGIVYEAIQKEIGRRVAIKVIPLAGSASKIAIDRFELERRAMGRVEHPNVVPVYSYGHDTRYAYLVMKLIEGHSLYDLQHGAGDFRAQYLFNELQTDPAMLATLGSQVASGLQHAHEQSLVHRDIKPANLLLDANGKVWITDFGLAKIYDYARSLSRTGDAIGTPRYMAPEQLRGACDARSDVYSLGITLYELAAGQRVWEDQTNMSLMTQRGSLSLTHLSDVRNDLPVDLAKIIMKACEFSPEDRYQTAEELQVVLDRFLAGNNPGDRRRRRREPDEVYRKKAKRRMVLAAAGVTLASFSVGLMVLRKELKKPAPTEQAIPLSVQRTAQPEIVSNTTVVDTAKPPELPPSPPNDPVKQAAAGLIDKLADNDQKDMVNIVKEFLNESLGQSGKGLNFSEPAQNQIRQQVDLMADQMKTKGLTAESLDNFLENYRKTSLPIATKVMRMSLIVQSSGLNQTEKNEAIQLLRGLAAAAANRFIEGREVNKFVDALTGGGVESTSEVASLRVPDDRLRNWLSDTATLISKLPREALQHRAVEAELSQAMNESFGPPPEKSLEQAPARFIRENNP